MKMQKTVWAFDIESDKFENVHEKSINFRFAVFKSENETKICKTKKEFEDFLLFLTKQGHAKNKKNVLYAHNLMFDFSFCIKFYLEQGFVIKPLENNGKLISVKIGKYRLKKVKNSDGTKTEKKTFESCIEFRDSFVLFQCSLKKLGQFVGLEKIEHDKNFSNEPSDEDIEYCIRDCEIVLLALKKMAEFHGSIFGTETKIEELPPTTASFAFKVFKHKNSIYDTKREKLVCPWILDNDFYNNLFLEQFYFGGRVELFKSEFVENVSYYDINSLYPYVMVSFNFHAPPYRIELFNESDLHDNRVVGFFAEIDERNESVPLVPCHHEKGLYFPAMVKKSFIFKEEYDYLKSRNVPIKIEKTLFSFNNPCNPFQYLMEFYELKNKKDSMSYFYKILMNSTYGRFGIDNEKEDITIKRIEDTDLLKENAEPLENELEGYVKIHNSKLIMFERNTLIASKITAMARLELTKWIHKLLENNVPVYYCDTDSIVTTENDILPIGTRLGQFKKEHECHWFCGLGNKEYIMKTNENEIIVKLKGVNKAQFSDFIDYYSDKGVEQINVSKFRTMMKKGWGANPRDLVMQKKNRTTYHKRDLLNNAPIRSFSDLEKIELRNFKIVNKMLKKIKKVLENE